MKYNSLVFAEILQVVDSPQPDPDTGRPEMPAVLQPTFTPGGISRPDQAGTRTESHFAGSVATVANAVALSSTLTTLKEGIWRITGAFHYVSTVQAAPSTSQLNLLQGALSLGNLCMVTGHTTIAIEGMIPIDVQLTLDTDTLIRVTTGANGVGERMSTTAQVHCQRIA